jgi:Tol biopolymer transport system component
VAMDNTISRNLVHGNGSLSIDLNGDGPTPNDPLDPDDGANQSQNFPELESATSGAAGSIIKGSLHSGAVTSYTLEFFSAPECDADGRGQAAKYLGTKTVTTDAAGDATFTAAFPTPADPGDDVVTSTATDPNGNTSEMSECASIVAPGSIAFTSRRAGSRDIFLMNGDGSKTRRLTTNAAADSQPSLAPGQVVFVSTRDGNRELYTIDLSGHHVTRLTNSPAGEFEPSVGPDGQIAFTSTRDGNREIYLLTPSGGTFTLTRLTNNPAADYDPSVGPDGDLLFVSNRSGHREVYRWQASGPPVRLTNDPAGNFDPSAGPAGSFAFTSLRDGNREIYRFDPASPTPLERLTTSFTGDVQPAINGDGATDAFGEIAFVSLRHGDRDIYLLDSPPTRLTTDPDGDFEPSWMAPAP